MNGVVISLIFVGSSLLLVSEIWAIFTTQAPFIPSPKRLENEIIETLKLPDGSVFYDLGCGNAKMLRKASDRYPGIKCVGIEMSFIPYFLSKFLSRNYPNIHIKMEDILSTDISDATHIYLYLLPKILNKTYFKIKNSCQSETMIFSCDFKFEDCEPIQSVQLTNPTNTNRENNLYIYKI